MDTAPVDDGPQRLLADHRRLARQVRDAQRATWFPLLVFAAVTFAAIPVYALGHRGLTCRPVPPGGRLCTFYTTSALVYWPIALVLAYVLIAGFYLRRARNRGVGTHVVPYAVAGIALAVLLCSVALWAAHHPPIPGRDLLGLRLGPVWLSQLATPGSAIGLALLVLAGVERNRVLAALGVGCVVFALVPATAFSWVPLPSPWYFLPRLVIGGGVLLLAGILFAVIQRPSHPTAA